METGNPAGVPFFIISRGGYMGVIRREDFIFALGYEGDVAVVDGRSRGKYRRYTAVKLAEEGLFKPAVCAAVYDEWTSSKEPSVSPKFPPVSQRSISIDTAGIFGY
jgi:hypothetical protein